MSVGTQRRQQIMEAARACITEEGVEKLTLRKVGERARLSHATVAYYFKTRRELIDSALLEISEDFMDELRQRHLLCGMQDLFSLVDTFLDANNDSARFVVQMIDAGLHDVELRPTHDEFIRYGRDRIERSVRVAMEMGDMRSDVDTALAAALVHTVLIWWQSEVAAGSAERDQAQNVGRLLLRLLAEPMPERSTGANRATLSASLHGMNEVSPPTALLYSSPDVLEEALAHDPRLTPGARETLSRTFRDLYELLVNRSVTEV